MAGNTENGDSLEVAQVVEIIDKKPKMSFTAKDLFYEKSLEQLVAQGVKFQITGYHTSNMALFDLTPISDDHDDEIYMLQKEILSHVKDGATKFKKMPGRTDVVIANIGLEFRRGVVMELLQKGEYANVYWVDFGGIDKVQYSDLMSVTEKIMMHPRLSYAVFLEDMFFVSNFILWGAFENLMTSLSSKQFTVTLGSETKVYGNFYSKKFAILSYMESTKVINLRDTIKQLRKWEWETHSDLNVTDADIYEKGKFGNEYMKRFSKGSFPMPRVFVAKYNEFSATITRYTTHQGHSSIVNISIYLLDDPKYRNYFNVLHYQLERYAENIKAVNFYPDVGGPLLFRLANRPKYRRECKILGRWVRAIRVTQDTIYLFDFDEYVPFPNEETAMDYDMRPLYYEFFKVPQLCITVRPYGEDKKFMTMREVTEKIANGKKRFQFLFKKDAAQDKVLYTSPYQVTSFEPVKKGEEDNFGISTFLKNHGN